MNTDWSDHIQGIDTLYLSRQLRFDDMFRMRYLPIFRLDERKKLRILEIGCGPGALAEALHRWYPQAEIIGVDRDSAFIQYAKDHIKGVKFLEGDATCLPFDDETFDVTISNTVSEHVEPSAFYGEQKRVLKKGGICLVLSARRGYNHRAACLEENDFEKAFWEKVQAHDHSMETYQVCKYPLSEQEHPLMMEKCGFHAVSTGYAVIDLTPDDPKYEKDIAIRMIQACRGNDLDAVRSARKTLPDIIDGEDAEKMMEIINKNYDERIRQYLHGEKQWNTSVSVTMVIRGEK